MLIIKPGVSVISMEGAINLKIMRLILFVLIYFSFTFDSHSQNSSAFSFSISTFNDRFFFCLKSNDNIKYFIRKNENFYIVDTTIFCNFHIKSTSIFTIGPGPMEDINVFLIDTNNVCYLKELDLHNIREIVINLEYFRPEENKYYLFPIPGQQSLRKMTRNFKNIKDFSKIIKFEWKNYSTFIFN